MKIRRIIFIVLGCLFAVFNLLVDVAIAIKPPADFDIPAQYKGDTAYAIGHYLGANLLFIIGAIFFYLAYRTSQKIKRKKEQELLDSFD